MEAPQNENFRLLADFDEIKKNLLWNRAPIKDRRIEMKALKTNLSK